MSHNTALVSMPSDIKEKAGLGRGVDVKVQWDEGLKAIIVKVIKAAP